MAEAKLAPNLPDWMLEHANRYLASGGTDGHMYKVTIPQRGEITAPALLLTTTGRKSGQKRTAPVVYLRDGENVVVINTNAGNAKVPAWSLNLKANPEGDVEVGRKRYPVRARIAEGEERERLWREHNEQYAGFDDYQEKLAREASVIVLEPR